MGGRQKEWWDERGQPELRGGWWSKDSGSSLTDCEVLVTPRRIVALLSALRHQLYISPWRIYIEPAQNPVVRGSIPATTTSFSFKPFCLNSHILCIEVDLSHVLQIFLSINISISGVVPHLCQEIEYGRGIFDLQGPLACVYERRDLCDRLSSKFTVRHALLGYSLH